MSESHEQEASLEGSLAAFAAELQARGIQSAVVEYTGAGDSCDGYEFTLINALGEEVALEGDLEDRLAELADDAISEAGHDGWENNEGGSGTFRLNVSGEASLEHTDNLEGEELDSHEFHIGDAEAMPGAPMTEVLEARAMDGLVGDMSSEEAVALAHLLMQALEAKGVTRAQMDYAGSGDSGDVESLSLSNDDGDLDLDEDDLPNITLPHTDEQVGFYEAMEILMWHCVDERGHSGWENEAGGNGSLTLQSNGFISIEHTDCFDDEAEVDCTSWEFEAPEPAAEISVSPSM